MRLTCVKISITMPHLAAIEANQLQFTDASNVSTQK